MAVTEQVMGQIDVEGQESAWSGPGCAAFDFRSLYDLSDTNHEKGN
jgi:hypothetical protein